MTICTALKIGMKLDQTFQNPLWPAWECTDADAELNWLTALCRLCRLAVGDRMTLHSLPGCAPACVSLHAVAVFQSCSLKMHERLRSVSKSGQNLFARGRAANFCQGFCLFFRLGTGCVLQHVQLPA